MTPRVAIRKLSLLGVIIGFAVSVPAAQLEEARVTQVVKDVKLLPTGAAARPAAISDEVRDGTAVRTGVDSRSELKFTDQTLARFRSQHALQFLRRYSQPEPARLSDASACPERSRWSKDQFIGRDRCDYRHHRDGGDTRVNEEEQEFLLQV